MNKNTFHRVFQRIIVKPLSVLIVLSFIINLTPSHASAFISTAASAGSSQVSSLGSISGFFSNPWTIGIGAAIQIASVWIRSQAHHEANTFVQNFQNPFGKYLSGIVDPYNAAYAQGKLSFADANKAWEQAHLLWAEFLRQGDEFGARGGDEATVWGQAKNQLGPFMIQIFADMQAKIDILKNQATTAASSAFSINDSVRVSSEVLNVRSTPSVSGVLLGTQSANTTGTITGEPVLQGGFTWWNVDYISGVDGWSAGDFLQKNTQTPSTPPVSSPASVNTPSCYIFNTNLTIGSTGDDVIALATVLRNQGFDFPGEGAYFGEAMAGAVVSFQQKYGILQSGYVGPTTRAKVNALCTAGSLPAPVPVPALAPTTPATHGQPVVTITTSSSLPNAKVGNYYYVALAATSGRYGEVLAWSLASGSSLPPGLSFSDPINISGTPTMAGTYTFTLQVSSSLNNLKLISTKQFTLTVDPVASTCSTSGFDPQTGFRCGCNSISGFSATTGLSCSPAVPTTPISGALILHTSTNLTVGQTSSWTITSNPPGLKAYWYGTKNTIPDVSDSYIGTTDLTQSYTYSSRDIGTFTRYVVLKDSSGQVVYTTNTINITVSPAAAAPTVPLTTPTETPLAISCSLDLFTSSVMKVGQTMSWRGTSSPTKGYTAYWYGTKNGVTDVDGAYAGTTDFTDSYIQQARDIGTFTRYLVLKDSTGKTVCTTDPVNIWVSAQTAQANQSSNLASVLDALKSVLDSLQKTIK